MSQRRPDGHVFFVIGLEVKREALVGELSSLRQAAVPLAAALGGSILQALLYTAFNAGPEGWGVPMATDIAFSLGILSLLGKGVPLTLKVLLVALADDLAAVLIIAFFYTSTISWVSLEVGGGFLVALIGANVLGIRHPLVYGILGIGGLWSGLRGGAGDRDDLDVGAGAVSPPRAA